MRKNWVFCSLATRNVKFLEIFFRNTFNRIWNTISNNKLVRNFHAPFLEYYIGIFLNYKTIRFLLRSSATFLYVTNGFYVSNFSPAQFLSPRCGVKILKGKERLSKKYSNLKINYRIFNVFNHKPVVLQTFLRLKLDS